MQTLRKKYAAATCKARKPLTLNISDDVRSVLDARRGLLAAEAAWDAAIQNTPLRSKKRQAADGVRDVARGAKGHAPCRRWHPGPVNREHIRS